MIDRCGGNLVTRLANVKMFAMDVDGVLTDGTLGMDSAGGEQKRFHVVDGLGLVLLRQEGIKVVWLSGRANPVVERRAAELGVYHLLQGVRDKGSALKAIITSEGYTLSDVVFLGDDWNDLLAFEASGVRLATPGAVEEVKRAADGVTERPGGHGAVREVCEAILDAKGIRDSCLLRYLASLRESNTGQDIGQGSGQ